MVLGPRQDTDRHQPDTHPAGEFHPVALLTEVLLATGAVSVIPEWEVPGLSAHPPGVEAPDFTVAGLEAADSREGEAEAFQEEEAEAVGVLQAEAAGVEDEVEGPDGVNIRR